MICAQKKERTTTETQEVHTLEESSMFVIHEIRWSLDITGCLIPWFMFVSCNFHCILYQLWFMYINIYIYTHFSKMFLFDSLNVWNEKNNWTPWTTWKSNVWNWMIITYGPLPSTAANRSLGALLPVSLVLFSISFTVSWQHSESFWVHQNRVMKNPWCWRLYKFFFNISVALTLQISKLDFSIELRTNNSSRDINGWRKSG